ncbi:MAG: hypothetical protein FJ206_01365 [Gemmatimonadetes bacterium]|nr:hypothetical protein [Gemmatimonadota bacterium]
MTHLSMEQLLAAREPGLEPGVQAVRDHLAGCDHCRAEADRIDQRIARLKALPTLRPARDHFGAVRFRTARERRTRQAKRLGSVGLALAASVLLAVASSRPSQPAERQLIAADPELAEMMSRSRELERALERFDPDRSVVNGRMVGITATLESRLADLDRQIEVVDLMESSVRQRQAVRLWRERVGLLDALVDVHLTGARYVGF